MSCHRQRTSARRLAEEPKVSSRATPFWSAVGHDLRCAESRQQNANRRRRKQASSPSRSTGTSRGRLCLTTRQGPRREARSWLLPSGASPAICSPAIDWPWSPELRVRSAAQPSARSFHPTTSLPMSRRCPELEHASRWWVTALTMLLRLPRQTPASRLGRHRSRTRHCRRYYSPRRPAGGRPPC